MKKNTVDYLKLLNYISSHNIVVHCKTKDEAINFCKHMGIFGVIWFGTLNNINTNTYYEKYNNKGICYNIRCSNKYKCSCGTIAYYLAEDYKILEWSDFMSFMPEDLEVGNVVEVNGNEYYVALKTDSESYLNFHNLDDGCINLLKFHFSKSQISDDWVVKKEGVPDAVITKVYRNFDDFKQRKNEIYNRIPDDGMTYSIGNPNDENHITISPNCDSYFDFENSEEYTIYIEKDNAQFDEFITLNYKNLPEFIDALIEIKNMYNKVGIYAKSENNDKPKMKRRSRYTTSEEDKKVCDEEWTF